LIHEEEIEYPALDEEEESAEKTEPGEGERAGIPPENVPLTDFPTQPD
jgi:hypothetical protein